MHRWLDWYVALSALFGGGAAAFFMLGAISAATYPVDALFCILAALVLLLLVAIGGIGLILMRVAGLNNDR